MDLSRALEHYQEYGWARIGRVVADDRLDELKERADDLMLGRVSYEGLFFQHDAETGQYEDLEFGKGYCGPSLNYRKIEKLELDPLFRELIHTPVFERIARSRIDGPVAIYRAVLFTKAAQGGTPLPWHQDAGRFWGLDRDPELQVWIALDDAPIEAGCVEVVSRSHHGGLATPLGGLVPEPLVLRDRANERSESLPASAGEVLLIHNHLWHRSGANRTGKPRRAFSICYMSAHTRCLRKKRAPRSFYRVFE
jgi:hypothetical protein